ncbi:hypothetical protein [Alloalcanivorax xenomutans]|uniref:hypothetical protein n=1 Tax=Alloalcanivorax xenomutans TaxID=1094342 RepID=UPI0029315F6C|nr:hypothetical protein [Alloalcanivorax xenomutans]WOA32270.1 hypothetical protein RVY87_04145 [Alloalcanivorax xenomutans]
MGQLIKKLKAALGRWPNGFRYVDDFYLFFERREEAEKALAELTKAIGDFELQVNASKTKIVEVRQLVDESWKFNIKKLAISAEVKSQKSDVHNYFESLFSLEAKYKDESLIKYGLKQVSSYIIKMDNWPIFEAYLLKCGYSFPNVIQVLANIFSTYKRYGYPINEEAVKRFCETEIKNHALSDHHSEVSWLLWICKELNFKISRVAVRAVEAMSSSVCALIVLDLYNSGFTSHNLRIDFLKKYSNADALKDAGWLLSYEAGRRGWLNNKDKGWIEGDEFFSALDAEGVSFYNEHLACKPIFEFRGLRHQIDENFFNDDRDIRDEFEFDEMDEEYFDSDSQDDMLDDIFL